MKTIYDVAIIGGGIIGCSIAYYLAKENIDVAVFEEKQIASKSTSAAAGMLGAHSECDDLEIFYPFARSSQLAYFKLQDELRELSGVDIELRKGGIFQLAYSAQEKEELSATLSLPTVSWYGNSEVRNRENGVSADIIGAAYIEDDVNVLPHSTCLAFSKSAQVFGASIFEYTPVFAIQKEDSIYTIKTNKGTFQAKTVVIANGVWSSSFFHQLGLHHTLSPVKGECVSVSSEQPLLKHTLFHEHCYIVPRNNGRLVIGATMVKNDWHEQPTLGGLESLIAKAKTMLPTVTDLKIESCWAGLRPQTFDNKPFIGHHPEDEGILFATGHFRNGILLAPATGQMIRDLIVKKAVRKDWIEAFKVNRL